jgi:hypothetical protein
MGLVGGGTVAGWTPSAVFPAQEMGYITTNLFLGITTVSSGGPFKPLDNNDWPNGAVDYTRDYEDGGGGKMVENGSENFTWTGATGPVRFIWDTRDVKNPRYIINGASPQMNYIGSGKWTITLNLITGKDIKFLAGNDWGAFDYEDNSGGSTGVGTPRSIRWDGSENFKTPASSGTYTITLDEYAGTVTIN